MSEPKNKPIMKNILENSTEITFLPDYKRFEMTILLVKMYFLLYEKEHMIFQVVLLPM